MSDVRHSRLQHLLSYIVKFSTEKVFRLAENNFVFLCASQKFCQIKCLNDVNRISESHSAYRGLPRAKESKFSL